MAAGCVLSLVIFQRQMNLGRLHHQHVRQRMVLKRYMNGDLSNPRPHVFNPYVNVMDDATRSSMLQEVKQFVVPALLPATCPLFSRSRWNGADGAIQWMGLLAGHHAGTLLRHTVQKFVGAAQKPQQAPGDGWLEAACSEVSQRPQPAPASGHGPAQGPAEEGQEADEVEQAASDWHQRSKKYKARADAFVSCDLHAGLMVMALVTGALQGFRHRLLQRASVAWRKKKYAQTLSSDRPSASCKVLDILEGKDVHHFYMKLWATMREPSALLQAPWNTQSSQALLFRACARAGGAVHQLLVLRRSGHPLNLFRLLADPSPEMAAEIASSKVCMRDELASHFLERFPEPENLLTPQAQAILSAIASRREFDIAVIECRHAASRRILTCSAQTWTRSLEHVSAFWSLQQQRIQREVLLGPRKEEPAAKGPSRAGQAGAVAEEAPKKKQRRKRSPWIAFLHETTGSSTQRFTKERMRELRGRYNALGEEELERLSSTAAAADAAAARNLPSFGLTAAQRKANRRQHRSLEAAAQGDRHGDLQLPGQAEDATSLSFGLLRALQNSSQEQRASARKQRETEEQQQLALRNYTEGHALDSGDHMPDRSHCLALPEVVPAAEFLPPLEDMAQAAALSHREDCRVQYKTYGMI